MAPRTNSRHLFTTAQQNDTDAPMYLADRTPYRFNNFLDNTVYEVKGGDTLHRIAAKHYASLGQLPSVSAANLWWVIADFQPIPIHDPTVQLVNGETLVLPSLRVVSEKILQRQRND